MQPTDPVTLASPTSVSGDHAQVYGRIARRLLPLLLICYVACYLDRVNVGFAKLQMAADLGFSDTVYGLGAGMFFIGYLAFEMPSNMILYRVGARLWLARIMITWALVSAATLFVHTPTMFYVMRFLLGIAEAGFFPGVVLYLTQWFPSEQRGKVITLFMIGIPIAGVLGGPVSGWIMEHMRGTGGLASWQWLFLLESLPSIVLGFVLFFFLPNNLADVKWMTSDEKQYVRSQLANERRGKADASFTQMLLDRRVWICVAINFCNAMGQYGIGFWLPTLVQKMGIHDNFEIGYLSAIPYAVAVVAMVLVSRSGDRLRERRWHVAGPALVGTLGFVLSTLLVDQPSFAIAALTLATAGVMTTLPLFWCLPTAFLKDASGAAGIGLINSVGGLAGFASPFLTGRLNDVTHDARYGVWMLAAWLVLSAFLILSIPAKLVNR
ncbi:MFS transporter [Caballeronia sp. LjRoot31]|uniref:MFS transporter n=1 Tax=Caballeronia sp. LjRoot31 TaxID=3342324 RepID=UPI003ED03724